MESGTFASRDFWLTLCKRVLVVCWVSFRSCFIWSLNEERYLDCGIFEILSVFILGVTGEDLDPLIYIICELKFRTLAVNLSYYLTILYW